MARNFRLYEKKRGTRRTGSTKMGTFGEAIFYVVLLLAGCVGLGWATHDLLLPNWRVNYEFAEESCIVLDRRVVVRQEGAGRLFRPEVKVRFAVGDRRVTVWTYDIATVLDARESYLPEESAAREALEPFVPGKRYLCWYDPGDPSKVVLSRGYPWWVWLTLLVPTLFIVIGGGGLVYTALVWGKSVERRTALAQRAGGRDLLGGKAAVDRQFPTVPSSDDISNSPGIRLAYRLPVATSPGWALFGLTTVTLIWNIVVVVFAWLAVTAFWQGEPDWYASAFLVPFALIGILLIGLLLRELVRTTGIGTTRVEISDHPLTPGGHYEMLLSQSGKLKAREFEVLLVCEERATYRQGTNVRTELREVYRQRLFRRKDFAIESAAPFEAHCALAIPEDAMHSFRAPNNAIGWRLVVRGNLVGWPRLRRDFSIVVRPGVEEDAV